MSCRTTIKDATESTMQTRYRTKTRTAVEAYKGPQQAEIKIFKVTALIIFCTNNLYSGSNKMLHRIQVNRKENVNSVSLKILYKLVVQRTSI